MHAPSPCFVRRVREPGGILAPRIGFEFDEVDEESMLVVDALARLLEANPWIVEIEIRVHENGGREPYGVNLTRRRANRLRTLLVERGVAESRLVARGYGEEQPLVPASSPDAARLNERVEFEITAVDR